MPNPDLRRYLDALGALGLQPGATVKDVRRAFRAAIRRCHPDFYPGDAAKAREARRVIAARDALEEMAGSGMLQVYANLAERDRRTTPGSGAAFLVVAVVQAPAGVGKTRGWVESIARRELRMPAVMATSALHVIMCAPTQALINQTAHELATRGVAAPVVTVIHAETIKGGVAPALRKFYARMPETQDAVLLCSHQAIFDTPLPPDPENWDIVFDEVPDCVNFLQITAPATHYHITNYVAVTPLPGSLYSLAPRGDSAAMRALTRIAVNQPPDDGLLHLQGLARALVRGHQVLVPVAQWDELVAQPKVAEPQYKGHADMLVIVPPTWFQRYRSVTMIGAQCLTHFTTLVWRRIWQVEFCKTDPYNLPRVHSRQQSERLSVRWIFEERVTRSFLARKAATGGTLFMAVCESVAKFHDGQPFVWSAPLPGEDKEYGIERDFWMHHDKAKRHPNAFEPTLRLPGRTHGLNRVAFLQAVNIALLSVVNLTPEQHALLRQLELTDDEIDRALAFDVAYQDALRCNLRRLDGTAAVSITVLDQRTATELADKFAGCRVERYPEALVPAGVNRPGKRGPAPSGTAQSSAERGRLYRARQGARRARRQETKRES